MKKTLLIIALTLGTIVSTQAQEDGIRFGAKAGLNLASISGDGTDDLSTRTALHAGALVEIPISDKFAFQPELLFSAQGAKFDFSDQGFTDESTFRLSYLNVPLMGKFYVAEGFSIQAGPQIGFLLSAKDVGEDSFNGEYEDDIKDIFKGIDFGVNFGLGYQLDMGLFFDGRYNLGLTDVTDEREGGDDGSNQNAVFQISVGYKF